MHASRLLWGDALLLPSCPVYVTQGLFSSGAAEGGSRGGGSGERQQEIIEQQREQQEREQRREQATVEVEGGGGLPLLFQLAGVVHERIEHLLIVKVGLRLRRDGNRCAAGSVGSNQGRRPPARPRRHQRHSSAQGEGRATVCSPRLPVVEGVHKCVLLVICVEVVQLPRERLRLRSSDV